VCPNPRKYKPSVLEALFEIPLAMRGSKSVGRSCFVLLLAAVTDGSIWLAHQYKMLDSASDLDMPDAVFPVAYNWLARTTIPSHRPDEMLAASR
jgi:hypothetical protein